MARLINPYTGYAVEAEGKAAERLMAHGFKTEAPAKKRAPRKAAPKKETKE